MCDEKKNKYGTIILILYVDGILVSSDDELDNHWLIHELEKEHGTISVDLKDTFTYLGMVLKKESNGEIQVYMPGYIEMMLSEYEKTRKIKSYTTPVAITLFSVDKESKELENKEAKHYHTSVARLLYLCRRVRIDVYLPVLYLYTKVKCPTESDLTRLDRVMGYTSLTKHKRRSISGDGNMDRFLHL